MIVKAIEKNNKLEPDWSEVPEGLQERAVIRSRLPDKSAFVIEFEKEGVPAQITAVQGKIQAKRDDILSNIELAIENSDEEVKIAWQSADSWNRYSKTIRSIQSALQMSEEDLDTFFINASKIEL